MGFMDSLGRAAGKAVRMANDKAVQFNEDLDKYTDKAERMTDAQLKEAYRHCRSTAERVAITRELEARGYTRKK